MVTASSTRDLTTHRPTRNLDELADDLLLLGELIG
jgi:hypothetical protein